MKEKTIDTGIIAIGYFLLFVILYRYGLPATNYFIITVSLLSSIATEYFGIKVYDRVMSLNAIIILLLFLIYGLSISVLISVLSAIVYSAISEKKIGEILLRSSFFSIKYSAAALAFSFVPNAGKNQVIGVFVYVLALIIFDNLLYYLRCFSEGQKYDFYFWKLLLSDIVIGLITIICVVIIKDIYDNMGRKYFVVSLMTVLLLAYNVKILQNLMEANKKLKALYELSSVINSRLDINQVGEAIIDAIRYVVNFSGVIIFFKKDEMKLEVVAWEMDDSKYCDMSLIKDREFIKDMMDIKEPVALSGQDLTQRIIYSYFPRYKSCMIVPLQINDECIGSIVIFHLKETAFTNNDIDIITTLSKQSATALSNARLYREVTKKSITDSLTKLYNRSYLFDILKDIIALCDSQGLNSCVIMIDIDHFKNVNDSYGHMVGDEVLKELAVRLRKCTREDDIVSRYGGEEFVVVLPAIDSKQAYNIAERIRMEVGQKPFDTRVGKLNITISSGICEYPLMAESLEKLIAHADRALYAAKANGRNNTVIYEEF